MTPVERVLAKLPGAKKSGKGWSARCPAHEDRNPSLSVSEGDDGAALLKCHTGCTMAAILAAVGLTVRDLFPDKADAAPNRNGKAQPNTPSGRLFASTCDAVAELERIYGKRSAMWTYHDATANPVCLVVRWNRGEGKKDIRPVSRHPDGWRIGAMPHPRPLYGLPELVTAKRVIVAEGEKAVDAARSLGFVATTSAGGSQAAKMSNWQPLAGKEVWILPDNDAPGRKYADAVAGITSRLSPPSIVKIVELPGLLEHGDIVDWIDARGDAAEPAGMQAEIEAIASKVPSGTTANNEETFQPFPVDVLPEPVRGFVAAGAKAIGCDPSYLALPLLTAIASAIGTTRRLELKRGWTVPAILWCAIVGESGTAKTPAFKLVMRPIRERQRKALERNAEAMKQYELEFARWEKCYAAWKRRKDDGEEPPEKPLPPPCDRYIVSDTTVEALAPILLANPRGLLLARDELAGWIGSFDRYAGKGKASADAANWLSMFNAETIIVDRKTGIPRTIYVPQAAVCVCGGIQPGILNRAIGDEHRESGLAARLLLTCPPRIAKQWTEADIDPKAQAELARLVDRLFELQPTTNDEGEMQPILVRLTPEAKTAWTKYYNAHGKEQVDLTGDMAAAWSKLEEYAARLALVVHYIRWAANEIADELRLDAASMNAGIQFATWFKGEARRVYALLGESEEDRDVRRLVEWIGRKGGSATVRETQQGCRWLKDPGTAEAALDGLFKENRGEWIPSPDGQRGQPTQRFALSSSTVMAIPGEIENTVDVDSVDNTETQPEHHRPRDGRLFPDLTCLPD